MCNPPDFRSTAGNEQAFAQISFKRGSPMSYADTRVPPARQNLSYVTLSLLGLLGCNSILGIDDARCPSPCSEGGPDGGVEEGLLGRNAIRPDSPEAAAAGSGADAGMPPTEGSAPSSAEAAVPGGADTSRPAGEAAAPAASETTPPSPAGEATAPADEATPPEVEATPPAGEATPPADEATSPAGGATPPAGEATLPEGTENTPPASEATPPASEATPPAGEATPPEGTENTPPAGEATPPRASGSGEGLFPVSPLGAAAQFAVLAASTTTCTNSSNFSGDVGVSPGAAITGFNPTCTLSGVLHPGDALAAVGQAAATAAFGSIGALPCETSLTGGDLGGQTLAPGVYCFDASAALTGRLTLDGGGRPGAAWVFQIGSTLITASNSSVVMAGGASACDVFWNVGSSATLGTGTVFNGNVLATASVTLMSRSSVLGRAVALGAAVTSDANQVGGCSD
jgi:ice-binding like protein